jgi:acyl-CoA synthetase (AMP-forming)/AMP-acid ligase II|tara:strand:- start:1114 stop:2688 length:1575 start_codon:yes stop_codon:yes gene_type:complete
VKATQGGQGLTVTSLMRQAARYNAHRTAIIHGGVRLTFSEAWDRGVQMANWLLDLGLQAGDRVGVLEDNAIQAQDFFLGSAIAGVVRVPLYARNALESHAHMLSHTGCRAVIVAAAYRDEIRQVAPLVPSLEHIIIRDEGYEAHLAGCSTKDPMIAIGPDDWCIIRHTGGTTGKAKGVAYSHRSWLAAGRDWFYNFPPMQAGDVCLHVGPISHGSGYLYTPTWLAGGVNLLLDHFDPAETLRILQEEQVGYLFVVPAMLSALANHPAAKAGTFAHLKVMQVGGAPIADQTAHLARAVFGEVLYQGYGQTEAVPVCMMGPKEWFSEVEGSNPLRSAGRALPYARLEIRDPEASDVALPLGAEGEIAILCDGQMLGFWENEASTRERMTSDGFVLTGDIGRLDHNGYLYVLDRKDDMIISGGFNIWPAELENVLLNHPDVLEVAVYAIPDQRWGETPAATCVIQDGAGVTALDLIELCAKTLGSYKKPTQIYFQTEPLPKSPVGKVQRKVLREPHWHGQDRRVSGN